MEIEFIGGEPFLPKSFELIKEIVAYIDMYYCDRDIIFVSTTNGTCVHDEVQEFLLKNSDRFYVSLSLDGRKESNDLNRPFKNDTSSFDKIDIAFFKKFPNPVLVKMTISPDTLHAMANDIEYIEDMGFECNATFATGIKWSETYNLKTLEKQLNILVEKYSNNTKLDLPKILQIDLTRVFNKASADYKYCGAGRYSKAFDYTGKCYPCQGFAPITLGNSAEIFENYTFEDFEIDKTDLCFDCIFRGTICRTCFSENYGVTGDIHKQPPQFCIINRMLALASSQIQFNRILAKSVSDITLEEQRILKAIEIIQHAIKDEKAVYLWDLVNKS